MPRRREPPLRRIGLFGGTFDPPHLGHLALAEWARERLRLDRVLFVPAGLPPHKRGARLSSAGARVAMTRLAVRGNPAFRLSMLEVRRRGPSFTVDTLRALRARHHDARLFLIMGEDSLDDFATWHAPATIARLATLAVARRPGRSAGPRVTGAAGARAHVVWLGNPGIELSSSAIRARALDPIPGPRRRGGIRRAPGALPAGRPMSYRPREFWEQILAKQPGLRGTGQPGMSEAYNKACYDLRLEVLGRALREAGFDPRDRRVLDVGCGRGVFTEYYLKRGARVTGIDIARPSISDLTARFPQARFILGDVSEVALEGSWDLINAFDVLYHIVDEARWETALRHLAAAVAPGGLLLVTDTFSVLPRLAPHNLMRSLERYRAILEPAGLLLGPRYPTHVVLNSHLRLPRFINNGLPRLLLQLDRALLALGAGRDPRHNKLLVARRGAPSARG